MIAQSNRINKRALDHQANANLSNLSFDLHIGCHSHMDLGWLNTYTGYQDRKFKCTLIDRNQQDLLKRDLGAQKEEGKKILGRAHRVPQAFLGSLPKF